jgi:hypothetical protein
MTKREWQIEMANRFAKRDNVKELAEKLECYERLADASEMASNPMGVKSRVALRNVREMKTIVTKDEALKMALDALIWTTGSGDFGEGGQAYEGAKNCLFPAITAIEEALAQQEQEPVAWMNDSTPSGIFARHMEGAKNFGCTIPLYTAPPQRKG